MTAEKMFDKYHKKENCAYPFEPMPAGYCWGYAFLIDYGESDEQIEKAICYDCEYFINNKEER